MRSRQQRGGGYYVNGMQQAADEINAAGGILGKELVLDVQDEGTVTVYMPHIGEYATSMEMAGVSLTIMKLDEELKALLSQTAKSPFYTNYNK